jgi:hypothetical protein
MGKLYGNYKKLMKKNGLKPLQVVYYLIKITAFSAAHYG